ncbi:ABC transporter permease subunit [Sulfuriflexus mobilis]|uniref:ABC transporter permease subunit n=1 Tax=Sulfuriflexus mobilis TaxID=1811807 RepID=UPI000F83FB1D|nr:ABC transporter permease subunit [Sulfuriflexus mobilis]
MSISATSGSTHQRWRDLKDHLLRHLVGIGGVGVIIAILLIFFYLFYVVMPMFASATAAAGGHYALPGEGQTLHLAMEEQAEIGVRFTTAGKAVFFDTEDGQVIKSIDLPLAADELSSFHVVSPALPVVGYGLNDGRLLVARHRYRSSFPNDQRLITPMIEYPLGEQPLLIDDAGQALELVAFQLGEEQHSVAAVTADGRLLLTGFTKQGSALDDDENTELLRESVELPAAGFEIEFLLMDSDQRLLYAADRSGQLVQYDISDREAPTILQRYDLLKGDREVVDIGFLTGSISLLVADSAGTVTQWFPVRDAENNTVLTRIRQFDNAGLSLRAIAIEHNRKGFATADDQGGLNIFHTTAGHKVLTTRVAEVGLSRLAFGPRANALLLEDKAGQLHFWHVENEYPEISWNSLWGKVWYESYPEPDYIWQSSSASNDFEPKFSLMPISFGTIKAAFYAMLIAVPLSIMGAIFTAYFMAPRMRSLVKPSIEIMEALPTVILGFLAGLWLAPAVETHMPGIFSLLMIMPLAVLLVAWLWTRLPSAMRHRVPEGWEALLLVPVILLIGWLSVAMSPLLEQWLFKGDMRAWLSNDLGIGYDQRNAVVVGLAMGFAVIPTIFSIAEDAIFSVPKQLSHGSLALGATPWQTMWRVVLLTASPGIFSAIMIGFGRAVGETMIVLMATGNTPVMDFSIFEGMRTLSANIAVEMPESEVGSTHYRVLFLAALVLFMFTFFFNTIAELVRQRLRRKYSSL